MTSGQHVLRQPLGSGRIRDAAIQHFLNDVVTAAHDVADYDAIRIDIELSGVVTLMDIDAQIAQLCAHGRVNVAVAATDVMARGARQRGHSAHEGPADSQYVYVHAASVQWEYR